jgi:hypothetical protein
VTVRHLASAVLALFLLATYSGSSGNPSGPSSSGGSSLPASQTMTALPVDTAAVQWLGPFTATHNGIDIGTSAGGTFFSVGDGVVAGVEFNTGQGLPETNYRINLEYTATLGAEYHFEIGGSISDQAQRDHVLVTQGQRVTAG